MNQDQFKKACDKVIHNQINREGIGRLQEKTVHAVLKYYFEPNEEMHEVRIGTYVADIAVGDRVIEIQTGNFNLMRRKLKRFLTDKTVTIVYPIPYNKWLYWLDPETGELSAKRKSPKIGTPHMAFGELYKIKEFLNHPNLSLHIVLIDLEEYRLLNGWSKDKKKGSSRYERIPIHIVDEVIIGEVGDYKKMIPVSLTEHFTAKDYGRETKLNPSKARTALHIMNYLGVVRRIGKKGRAYLYEVNDSV